jgi:hypothetical protein
MLLYLLAKHLLALAQTPVRPVPYSLLFGLRLLAEGGRDGVLIDCFALFRKDEGGAGWEGWEGVRALDVEVEEAEREVHILHIDYYREYIKGREIKIPDYIVRSAILLSCIPHSGPTVSNASLASSSLLVCKDTLSHYKLQIIRIIGISDNFDKPVHGGSFWNYKMML